MEGYTWVSKLFDFRLWQAPQGSRNAWGNRRKDTEKYQAAHKDGNPAHNAPGNLQWKSPKENADDQCEPVLL